MEYKNENSLSRTRQITHIGLVAAVLCILGPLSIPLPFSPVPISLTQFGVYIAVYALGRRNGTISVVLYMLMGALGLPVFSGFAGGFGKLVGPTGGYLLGFVVLAFVLATFVDKDVHSVKNAAVGMLIGNAAVYLLGTGWLAVVTGMDFMAALVVGVVPYLVFDAVKAVLAVVVGPRIRDAVVRVSNRADAR